MQAFHPLKLVSAYALDLVAGDPPGMPHPVRLMGAAITYGEKLSRPGKGACCDFTAGLLVSSLVVTGSWFAGSRLGTVLDVLFGWTTLATGSLIHEADQVVRALETNQISEARRALAMIVGRDTKTLDEAEVSRAVIETVAEGLCDGVAAPLFYLALGGVPLALAYKALNTLDSMIGHPEPPYTYFGRFAARADDVANFPPARLTAWAIILASGIVTGSSGNAWRTWAKDGHKHPSPNAAQSEAAMAGALQVRLGGMNYYQGKPSSKPWLGGEFRAATPQDARRSLTLARIASACLFTAALAWCTWKHRR